MSASRTSDQPRAVVYTDRLLRPFLNLAFIAVVATQLAGLTGPWAGAAWWLFVPVTLLTIWSLLPIAMTPQPVATVLLVVSAVLSGVLFAIPVNSYAAGFVFLAALSAGLLLESPRAAIAVAVVASLASVVAAFALGQVDPHTNFWWIGLTAGLPVYIGIARRERGSALAAAQLAAAEAERARASEAREAALIERGRIAREIHDVLGHSLSAIAIQLDMADTLFDRGRLDESRTALRRARGLARSGIGETRRAVHALQEDSKPLPEALAAIASSFDARFTLRGTPTALRVESDQTLIRAMQEALTNAHRHAPGASLAAELDYDEAAPGTRPTVAVTIVNGTSTEDVREPDEPEGTGMGLQGMRERAALLGGTVTAGPVDGRAEHGWVVTMRLPR